MSVKKVSNKNSEQFTKKFKRYSIHLNDMCTYIPRSFQIELQSLIKIMILHKSHDFELLLIFLFQ